MSRCLDVSLFLLVFAIVYSSLELLCETWLAQTSQMPALGTAQDLLIPQRNQLGAKKDEKGRGNTHPENI
jgi:hypothetical protein